MKGSACQEGACKGGPAWLRLPHKGALPEEGGVHTALRRPNQMSARPTNHYTTLHPGPRPLGPTSSGPRKQMARWKTTDSRGLEMKTQFLISGWRSAALPVATSGPRNRIEAGIGSSAAGGALHPIQAWIGTVLSAGLELGLNAFYCLASSQGCCCVSAKRI